MNNESVSLRCMNSMASSCSNMALECKNIRKYFGLVPAVTDLSITVKAGQIYALLGPNGAGKTTTLRIIVGLLRQDDGDVFINGISTAIDKQAARRQIAYVPDEPLLYNKLTPVEQLEFVAGLWSMKRSEAKPRAEALLQLLGVWDHKNNYIESLSRGMKQKTALAVALLHAPSLIILDEPLTGLDVDAVRIVKEILRDFTKKGGTVILSSHLLDVVERVADRIAIINRGIVIAEGTLSELQEKAQISGALEDVFIKLIRS